MSVDRLRKALLGAALALFTAAPIFTAAEEARAGELLEEVRAALADPRYRFCHEADYPLTSEEKAWCPLLDEQKPVCPSLLQACTLPPIERSLSSGLWPGRKGHRATPSEGCRPRKAPGEARAERSDTRERPPPPPSDTSLPKMSGFAQILFFGLLAVFIVAVARAIAQNFQRERADEGASGEALPGEVAAQKEAAAVGPVETDVERLLARGRDAAARGEYARALDHVYAALLRRLDGDGLIEIHPSRTNGDYLRKLRAQPELHQSVRAIAGDVERAQFGATPPSERVFREVLARVLPLVGRALGVLLFGLCLSGLLSCAPHDGGAHRGAPVVDGDPSPLGARAVAEVMNGHGLHIRHRIERLSSVEGVLTLVLLPGVELDGDAWAHLSAWVRDGGRLVLAGVPVPAEVGLKLAADPESPSTTVYIDPALSESSGELHVRLPPGRRLVLGDGQSEPEEGVLLRSDASVIAAEMPFGEGMITVFAEDSLFTNLALTVNDNALLLLATLFRVSEESRVIEICDAFTGVGAATPLESVRRAELTPVLAQLFVLLALVLVWKGAAFARRRDPPAEARRAFADHVRALGLAYASARASHHVVGLYASWGLERLRERVHRSGGQGLLPLAEAIAARTGRSEGEVMRVLVEAAGSRDEAAPPSSLRLRPRNRASPKRSRDDAEADFALMRELSAFLEATGQHHRRGGPPPPPTLRDKPPTT